MNTFGLRNFILWAALAAVMLGFSPERILAQQGNPPPAQRPPRAGAVPSPVPPAPHLSPAASDGAGWLGITMSEVTPDKAKEAKLNDVHGVVITGVSENSPAAKAGLAGGDIITEFHGERVEGMMELARLVRETPAGRTVELSVWRDGRSRDFSVEIGRAPALLSRNFGPNGFDNPLPPDFQDRLQQRFQRRFAFPNAPAPPSGAAPGAPAPAPQRQSRQRGGALLGIAVQDVSGQLGAYLKVPGGQGVLVTDVQSGSAAEKGGLHAGDVIMAVDGQRVHNTNELRTQVRSTQGARTAAIKVIRNGVETTVNVEVSPAPQPGSRRGRQPAIPI